MENKKMPPSAPKADFEKLKPENKEDDPLKEWQDTVAYSDEKIKKIKKEREEQRAKEREDELGKKLEKFIEEEKGRDSSVKKENNKEETKKQADKFSHNKGYVLDEEETRNSNEYGVIDDKEAVAHINKVVDKKGLTGKEKENFINRAVENHSINKENLNEKEGIEALKNNLEESYQELLDAQKNQVIKESKVGSFRKLLMKIGIKREKEKKSQVVQEYLDSQENYNKIYEKYTQSANQYYQALFDDFKKNWKDMSGSDKEGMENTQNAAFRAFVFGEEDGRGIIKVTETNERGEKVEKEKSIWQDMMDRRQNLDQRKMELLGDKERGNIKKVLIAYSKIPKKYRILGATIVGGTMVGMGGGLALGLSYGSYKMVKSLGILGLSTVTNKALKNTMGRERGKDIKNVQKDVLNNLEGKNVDLVKAVDEFCNRDKWRNRRKIIGTGLVAAIGGFGAMNFDDVTDLLSGTNTNAPISPYSKDDFIGLMKDKGMSAENAQKAYESQLENISKFAGETQRKDDFINLMINKGMSPEDAQKAYETQVENIAGAKDLNSANMHFQDNGDEMADDSKEIDVVPPKQFDAMKVENISEEQIGRGVVLGKGGNVWSTLEKVYGNTADDEVRIGNLIHGFKKDLIQEVMDDNKIPKSALSAEKLQMINERIEGRFRSLEPDQIIRVNDSQGLELDGFCDADLENDIKDILKTNLEDHSNVTDSVSEEPLVNPTEDQINKAEEINSSENAQVNADAMAEGMRQADSEIVIEGQKNLETNLERLDLPLDSNAWETASEMKVKDLLETIPGDEEQAWEMWRNNEVSLDFQKKLGMVNGFYNYGKLIRLSQFINEHKPSASDLEMTVEEYLKNNI